MALSVTALETRLPTQPRDRFSLAFEEIGLPGAEPLFTDRLDSRRIDLRDAAVLAPGELAVRGLLRLPGYAEDLDATVTFLTDARKDTVTGFAVDVTVPGWRVVSGGLDLDLSLLGALGFTDAHMAFLAEQDVDGGPTDTVCRTAVAVAFPSPAVDAEEGESAYLFITPDAGGALCSMSAVFAEGLSLDDLGNLAALPFGGGTPFHLTKDLRALLPGLDLSLTEVEVTVDLVRGALVSAGLRVRLVKDCDLDPVRLRDVYIDFSLLFTPIGTALSATLTARSDIVGFALDASVTVPELDLEAALTAPLAALPEAARAHVAGTPLGSGPVGRVVARAGLRSRTYSLLCELAGGWQLAEHVTLTELSLLVAGGRRTSPTASVAGAMVLGATSIRVEANGGADGWQLSGLVRELDFKQVSDWLTQHGLPVPVCFTDLTLHTLALEATTQPASCQLVLGAQTLLGGLPAAVELRAQLAGAHAGASGAFTAAVSLVLPPNEESDGGVMRLLVDLSRDDLGTRLTAGWSDAPGLSLVSVASLLGIDVANVPRALVPTLTELDLSYASSTSHLLFRATTAHTEVVFASSPRSPVPTAATLEGSLT
ncbi:hypothetical protein GCM10010341_89810 [Streptomyces noursei]|nr:hypothetical protein GCM10010341_89810 [Streptomyces noursei]